MSPRRVAAAATAALVVATAGCGQADRGEVEDAVRERARTAAPIDGVACTAGDVMWGCRLRLRDGREQACQATVADGKVRGVACQPLRGE